MALVKQAIPINFAQGLDLKTDKFQVSPGKFLSLQNSVFNTAGQLSKRNGYGFLTPLSNASYNFLTTFNENLTAIGGGALAAYSQSSMKWVDKGHIQPVTLDTLPLIRSNFNQTQADSAVASNGLVCLAYTDFGDNVSTIKYAILDSSTGQNIVAPTAIPASGTPTGSPRVFILGNYFIILFTNLVTSTSNLQYIAININDTSIVIVDKTVANGYGASPSLAYDAIAVDNKLFIAYNTTLGGQSVKITYIDTSLNVISTKSYTHTATMFSLAADSTNPSNPIIYVSFYDSGSSTGYTLAVDTSLNTQLAATQIISSGTVLNIISSAQAGVCCFTYEIANNYTYDSTIASHYLETNTITFSGTLGTASVLVRSLGLASKAFTVNGLTYFMGVYSSAYQPTYFLVDQNAHVVAKLAYSNASPYYTTGLTSVSVSGNTAQVAYLFKDLIQSVNKTIAPQTPGGIYSQTGINLATFNIGSSALSVGEIGSNLNVSGGFLWAYDGYIPVEQNFFLWPDSIETTWIQASPVTPTGNTTSGSTSISSLSSSTGIFPGMTVTGTGIPTGATVISVGVGTLVISAPATATNSTVTLTIEAHVDSKPDGSTNTNAYYYQVCYEWTDNQGNIFRSAPSIPVSVTTTSVDANGIIAIDIPTLRLTYKTANPVKIGIYRWSVQNPVFYQVTSIQQPILNDTSVDSLTYFDTLNDSSIIGNSILYTTGGVIENIGPPSTNLVTLFNNRLWLVDAEDKNLLWFSKQVIEATPVEMSDLLTLYVAPTTSAQGSTGVITAIAALDDKLIIYKKNAIYYINGSGPNNTGAGNAYSDATFVTATVGCTNQQSIVFIPSGLLFQSDKGIWLLGRDLSTSYIGAPVEGLTNGATVQSAVNVPGTNQVRFTLSSGITLMYDYYYGQWGTFTGTPAVSSTLYQGFHTYINRFGQSFQETPGVYLDGSSPVLMAFTTGWMSFAGLQGYERFYQMYLLGQYLTPFKLNVQFAYDFNSISESHIVTPQAYSPPWGGDQLWGSGSVWGGASKTFEARIFPSTQKVESFQITINEKYDASYGVPSGQGLTLSGMNLVTGVKKGYRTQAANKSF